MYTTHINVPQCSIRPFHAVPCHVSSHDCNLLSSKWACVRVAVPARALLFEGRPSAGPRPRSLTFLLGPEQVPKQTNTWTNTNTSNRHLAGGSGAGKRPRQERDKPIIHHTILLYSILYILYYTILYYTILYYNILYYSILYYTIQQHNILWYDILWSNETILQYIYIYIYICISVCIYIYVHIYTHA